MEKAKTEQMGNIIGIFFVVAFICVIGLICENSFTKHLRLQHLEFIEYYIGIFTDKRYNFTNTILSDSNFESLK